MRFSTRLLFLTVAILALCLALVIQGRRFEHRIEQVEISAFRRGKVHGQLQLSITWKKLRDSLQSDPVTKLELFDKGFIDVALFNSFKDLADEHSSYAQLRSQSPISLDSARRIIKLLGCDSKEHFYLTANRAFHLDDPVSAELFQEYTNPDSVDYKQLERFLEKILPVAANKK